MTRLLFTWMLTLTTLALSAQGRWAGRNLPNHQNDEFFQSDEARRIGDQVLLYQRVTGGWPKNINMATPLNDEQRAQVLKDKERRDDSTTDNSATSQQIIFLARLYQGTKDDRYKEGFLRGVEYLLSGQYANGGWPQFWPEMHGYQIHITYNDDAMVNTMKLLRDVARQKKPYEGLADAAMRQRCQQAFDKGVECMLATQMRNADGVLTVWCQQHDRETLAPAAARAYELPSYCSMESASIVKLLMQLPHPDERVKQAVHAAMAWFDKYKLTGLKVLRSGMWASPESETRLVEDSTAGPLWGRYYDLKYCEPYVCDRDGLPRRRLEDIGHERRNGYAWFSNRPAELYPLYEKWVAKNDPKHKVAISLTTKGANENGLIEMFRQPEKHMGDFDVVVREGESIQSAIEKAPEHPEKPFKIFICKGTYRQKVIIDRPNIVHKVNGVMGHRACAAEGKRGETPCLRERDMEIVIDRDRVDDRGCIRGRIHLDGQRGGARAASRQCHYGGDRRARRIAVMGCLKRAADDLRILDGNGIRRSSAKGGQGDFSGLSLRSGRENRKRQGKATAQKQQSEGQGNEAAHGLSSFR